jgi:hypothetical protein
MTANRVAAIGLGAAALVVSMILSGSAQTPPAQPSTAPATQQAPAQPAASAQTFSGDAGLIYTQIKPDKTADYEAVMNKYKEALTKSDNADEKAMAAGMKLYKSPDPGPNVQGSPTVLYVWVVNPTVKNADYSANAMIKTIAKAFPTEATGYYNQLKDALVGRSPLNLQLVNDFGK